jgi:hypothetical protein
VVVWLFWDLFRHFYNHTLFTTARCEELGQGEQFDWD